MVSKPKKQPRSCEWNRVKTKGLEIENKFVVQFFIQVTTINYELSKHLYKLLQLYNDPGMEVSIEGITVPTCANAAGTKKI